MEGSFFLGSTVGSGGVMPDQDTAASFQQGGTGQPVNVGITQASLASPQQPTAPAPAPQQSRLQQVLSAVVTGLSAIPSTGRPGFVSGLGSGARAQQQAQAVAQEITFRDLDSQLRLAQLHAQDIKMQNDTQAQQDAHMAAELHMRQMANDLGLGYDTIANHGPTVMDHLAAQTAATGSASVPAGSHISADAKSIYLPSNPDSQRTRDAQMQMYSQLAPALGLPGLPQGAQLVPDNLMNMLTNKINGFGIDGKPINHDDLTTFISAMQTKRDQLAKSGGTTNQLQTLDNVLGIYKANLKALDDHKAYVMRLETSAKAQGEADVANNPANQAAAARGAKLKAGAEAAGRFPYEIALAKEKGEQKNDSTELNAVAFDPNFQNADGTRGADVVMSKSDAQAKGLQHYKADASTINTVVGGMNDVQNKLNQLADVATDPKRMGQVQPQVAADMLRHGHGIELGAFGTKVDTSTIDADLAAYDSKMSNQATRDFVTAMVGANEAITQLPRLQTFGKSNRMTEQQMQAAQKLLPQPGESPDFASQKMRSLQGMIDPLRKQVPHMPGAEQIPSWTEQRRQQQTQAPSGGSNLSRSVMGNTDFVNRLQPTQ